MDALPRTPSGQYSLRTVMLVVLALAVLCAVAAPFVRTMSGVQRWLLAAEWMTFLVTCAFALAIMYRRGRRLERLAGNRLLVMAFNSGVSGERMTALILINSFIMLGGIGVLNYVLRDKPSFNAIHLFNLVAISAGLGIGIAQLTYQFTGSGKFGDVEICENGLVIGMGFVPWSNVRSVVWEPTTGRLRWNINRTATQMTVPLENRVRLGHLLRQYVATSRCRTVPCADSNVTSPSVPA